MGLWFGPSPAGASGTFTENDFSYSGSYRFATTGSAFELAFLTSGTLKLKKALTGASLFLVGGGDAGQGGTTHTTGNYGGNGGEVKTTSSLSLAAGSYTVTIGGSGEDTTVLCPDGETTYKAEHGKGQGLGGVVAGRYGHAKGGA